MSKGPSFKNEPFSGFSKEAYSFVTDDFVHEKLLTVKVAAAAGKGTVNLKQQLVNKNNSYKTSGEIKVWFPAWNKSTLYFKSVNDELRLHYDHGVTQQFGHDWCWYGSVQKLKREDAATLKLGAIWLHKNFELNNRVRLAVNSGVRSFSTSHKLSFNKDKWGFEAYEVINWGPAAIATNALRIAYRHNEKTSLFLRASQTVSRKCSGFDWLALNSYFGSFIVDAVHKIDEKTTLGA